MKYGQTDGHLLLWWSISWFDQWEHSLGTIRKHYWLLISDLRKKGIYSLFHLYNRSSINILISKDKCLLVKIISLKIFARIWDSKSNIHIRHVVLHGACYIFQNTNVAVENLFSFSYFKSNLFSYLKSNLFSSNKLKSNLGRFDK